MTESPARSRRLPTRPSWATLTRPGPRTDVAGLAAEPVGERPGVHHHPGQPSPGEVLRLQRLVGNQATSALLRRRRRSDPAADPIPMTVSRLIFRSWSSSDLYKTDRQRYERLKKSMQGKEENENRQLIYTVSLRTASPDEAEKLIQAVGSGKRLVEVLNVTGSVDKFRALSDTFKGVSLNNLALLAGAAGDYESLIKLAAHFKEPQALYIALQSSGKPNAATTLLEAITLAGSYEELQKFMSLSKNVVELRDLLKALGKEKLTGFLPVAKDAATILAMLDITDADALLPIMTTHQKADLATLRPPALKGKAFKPVVRPGEAKAVVDPANIRFTQSTCSGQGDGYTVEGNIQKLKTQPNWHIPGDPIRVFQKTPEMDAWGPLSMDFGIGNPKNLENDQIYSLDNRRLVAYQRAGRPIPKPALAPLNLVKDQRWKFTTKNKGTAIAIQ